MFHSNFFLTLPFFFGVCPLHPPPFFAYSSKLFNCCLKKKKCFPSLCRESAVCPVFKNVGELLSTLQYYPIRLVSVISKFLEPTINKKVVDYLSNPCWLKVSEYTNCPPPLMRPPVGCGWWPMMPGDGGMDELLNSNVSLWPLPGLDWQLEKPNPINQLVMPSHDSASYKLWKSWTSRWWL